MPCSISENTGPYERKTSSKLLVKNIPMAYFNEEYIQMFFEYTKGQGGGAVKMVELKSTQRSAIVEFESTQSVNTVLMKRPIRIMGTEVVVEIMYNYLETGECLDSANVVGLEENLGKGLKTMQPNERNSEWLDQRSTPEILIEELKKKLNGVEHENHQQRQEIVILNEEKNTTITGLNYDLERETGNRIELDRSKAKVQRMCKQIKEITLLKIFLDIAILVIYLLAAIIGGWKGAVAVGAVAVIVLYSSLCFYISNGEFDEFRKYLRNDLIQDVKAKLRSCFQDTGYRRY